MGRSEKNGYFKTTEYQRHLKACEEKCGKGTFAYGNQSVQTFPESLIKEAAQDVYNRLSGRRVMERLF